ncbi:MAG TPA: carboxypeptidase-like regulatory domain-containing protein [Terriglobia bacterium]|nr:carboxypeptidase-like regulatory domain-containing protein [Terriglobia bacterium]
MMDSGDRRLAPHFGQDGRPSVAASVWLLAAVTLVALLGASPAAAKKKPPVPRMISGRVFDRNDTGISGATVELTDLQTSKTVAIYTGSDGRYQFSDLDLTHDYQVRASYQGVASETRKASSLEERQLVLNLHIPPPKDE